MKKYDIAFCKNIATEREGLCLSLHYYNTKTKLLWQCKEGHQWYATLDTIIGKNAWCKKCADKKNANNLRADGLKVAYNIARSKGGKCLSTTYTNMNTDMLWECSKGHTWVKKLSHIKYRDQWCPHCSKRPPLSIKDCVLVAESRNGKCLSKEYINSEQKLKWECSKGHVWEANLRSVRVNKSWCPSCKRSKGQEDLQTILENMLKEKAMNNYYGFDWFRNPSTNRKFEIDIWFPTLKLAVEYDGKQHFEPLSCFGGIDEYDKVVKRDSIKNKLLLENKDVLYFIRVSYRETLSVDYLRNKLLAVGMRC